MRSGWALLIFVAMAIVAGCGGHSGTPGPLPSPYTSPFTSPPTSPPSQAPFAPQNYIKHVVFIIQENRSFDNLFYGYPGANTATSGQTSTGATVQLHSAPLNACYDPDHNEIDFLTEYNGGAMNGFDQILSAGCTPPTDAAYAYVPAAESAPYFALAKQFVLADNNFASQIDASWTAHQFLIAAQSDLTVDAPDHLPWGCDSPADTTVPTLNSDRTQGPGISPCLNYTTFGDELDAKDVSWRYYAPAIGSNLGGWPVRYVMKLSCFPLRKSFSVSKEVRYCTRGSSGAAGKNMYFGSLSASFALAMGSAKFVDQPASSANVSRFAPIFPSRINDFVFMPPASLNRSCAD